MSRLVVAMVIIGLIIGICVFSLVSTYRICNQIDAQAQKALEFYLAEDYQNAEVETQKLKNLWQEKEHTLVLYVRHNVVDEIGTNVFKLQSYLQYRDTPQYTACIQTIQSLLEDLLDSETPFYYNILSSFIAQQGF